VPKEEAKDLKVEIDSLREEMLSSLKKKHKVEKNLVKEVRCPKCGSSKIRSEGASYHCQRCNKYFRKM